MTARLRIWALFLGTVLASACSREKVHVIGVLEVVQNRSGGPECTERRGPRSGALELAGLDGSSRTLVSIDELSLRGTARRQLAAGLYSVSWVPDARALALESDAAWVLPKPRVVIVVPGQVARLTVSVEKLEC